MLFQSRLLSTLKVIFRAYLAPIFLGRWYLNIPVAILPISLLVIPIDRQNFEIPPFTNLKVSTGYVYFDYRYENSPGGMPFGLKSTKGIMEFSCGLLARRADCVPKERRREFTEKPAKVWWYQENFFFLS